MACDQMKEPEKTVDYESFMRDCLACESVPHDQNFRVWKSLDCSVGLFHSVEKTALARAKATLLMKALLERVANEQDARKKAERLAGEKQDKTVERQCP